MLFWLKKYFIPNEGNEYKPYALRAKATIFILIFVLLTGIIFFLQIFIVFPKTNFFASVLPNVLIDLTNNNRGTKDLPALKATPLLKKAAQQKAQDMAQKGYFAHISPDGKTPWHWFDKVGYRYIYAGENIAIHFYDSQDLVKSWMGSSSHRTNILNENFTEIGIGIAQGMYNKKETVFIVQLFGRPAITTTKAATKPLQDEENGPEITPGVITEEIKIPPPEEIPPEIFIAKEIPNGITSPQLESSIEGELEIKKETEIKQPSAQSSSVQRFIASPRVILKYLYFILFAIITLMLILNIFVKIKIQHPSLIMNGLLIIITITSMFLLNNYLMISKSQIF